MLVGCFVPLVFEVEGKKGVIWVCAANELFI